jgi:cytoskeleton protein RodZ
LTDPLAEPVKVHLALGAALRTAREQLKFEIDDVAQQLRMSAYQVNALEQDNLAALPAPTFVRGFIRNYARLLHMEAAPLLDAYNEMLPDSQAKNSITLKLESIPITNNAQKSFRLYLLTSFLLIVIGSGWWLYMEWNDKQLKMHTAAVSVELPKPAVAKPPPESKPSPPSEPLPQMQSFVAQPAPATQKAPAPQQPPAAPVTPVPVAAPVAAPVVSLAPTVKHVAASGSIHMTFSEQTWVSVTDATGKEVFNKTKAADTEDTADGTPPFNIVIGNSAGIQMSYKDQPVDITSHTKANVARFTLP